MAALLANPPVGLCSADLFTFTLRDGITTYRWTSYDRDLTVNSQVYSSRKPWLQRSRWSVANAMQVPTLEVRLLALNTAFAGGIDIKGQITNGLLDGATATLDRVWFLPGTGPIVDIVDNVGGVSAVNVPATSFTGSLAARTTSIIGFLASDTFTVSKPHVAADSRLLWDGWSAWAADNSTTPIPPPVVGKTWNNGFSIYGNNGGSDVLLFTPALDPNLYTTEADAYAALAAQLPISFSGYTSYKVVVPTDATPMDNRHGVSLLVSSGLTHAGIRLFGGTVGNIEITGNEAAINVKGKTNLLDQYAPRNLYQLGCEHAFCDVGCTLSRVLFTASYTVGSVGVTRTFIPWNGAAPANASNYRFGTVTFTSGVCSGQARTVRAADSTGLTLIHPLIGIPAAGDAFTAFEGCDKALNSGSGQDCTARSNTQNWRAFPYVPPADSAF